MADDDAAARREARRREREARRKQREQEEEEPAPARSSRRRDQDTEETDSSSRDGSGYISSRRRREVEKEEEERKQKEKEEAEAAERQRQREEEERRRQEEEEERQREEEEEEERRRQEREEARRRRREQEEEEERERARRRKDEEHSSRSRFGRDQEDNAPSRRRRGKEEEEEATPPQDNEEAEEEEETIFEQMSPQKKAAILEGLAAEFRRIVEARDAKGQMVAVSAQELDELDLKVRSLRTQVRKAEETSNALQKQQKELEIKIKNNENDVQRLKKDLQAAEAENELAIKEGKKVAPTTRVAPTQKKASPWGGFVNVVRKAQSAAWEEKFKAMKAKKQSNEDIPASTEKASKKPEIRQKVFSLERRKTQGKDRPDVKPKPKWQNLSLRKTEGPKAPLPTVEVWKSCRPDWSKDLSPTSRLRKRENVDMKSIKEASTDTSLPPRVRPRSRTADNRSTSDMSAQRKLLTADLQKSLRTKFGETPKISSETRPCAPRRRGGLDDDPDTSHTHKPDVRKFADHRRNVRLKTRHRPSTNPVRGLRKRRDVRSEL